MKKIIIFGIGAFSDLLAYNIISQNAGNICGYTVDEKYYISNEHNGRPVVKFEDIENFYSPTEYEILIGVTEVKMCEVRQRIFEICKEKGFKIASFVDKTAICESDIGEGNILMYNTYIGPFCSIGKGNVFMENVLVPHYNKIGDFNYLTNCKLSGYTCIENNCFIGINSCIKNYVNIAQYTLVGAGAYVSKDTKPFDVVVPVKSITLEGKKSMDFI